MIPENFPLAENIGPGHVPRHGSVTGTATERQQPLPCRLQAPAGNAAVFPGQAPRFGEPFFLPMGRSVRTHQTAHGRTRQKKCRLTELPGRAAGKGLCRCAGHDGCRSSPVAREKTGVRRGRGRIAVPRLMTALRQGPGGDRSGASPVGAVCHGNGTGTAGAAPSALPYVRNGTAAAGRRLRRRGKKRLVAVGACHLRAFGLWKLVHRSTLRQRPGVPGNALRRIFRCLPVMGPGAAAGRVAGSGPVWKITTLLED